MIRIALVIGFCMLALAACGPRSASSGGQGGKGDAEQQAATSGNSEAVAKDLVTALAAGDMAKVTGRFDATMKAALPPEKLQSVWAGVGAQYGAFKQQTGVRTEKVGGFDAVFVTCEFERGKANVQVTVDSSGKVSGLFIRPV
jgi:hypothetical protein